MSAVSWRLRRTRKRRKADSICISFGLCLVWIPIAGAATKLYGHAMPTIMDVGFEISAKIFFLQPVNQIAVNWRENTPLVWGARKGFVGKWVPPSGMRTQIWKLIFPLWLTVTVSLIYLENYSQRRGSIQFFFTYWLAHRYPGTNVVDTNSSATRCSCERIALLNQAMKIPSTTRNALDFFSVPSRREQTRREKQNHSTPDPQSTVFQEDETWNKNVFYIYEKPKISHEDALIKKKNILIHYKSYENKNINYSWFLDAMFRSTLLR